MPHLHHSIARVFFLVVVLCSFIVPVSAIPGEYPRSDCIDTLSASDLSIQSVTLNGVVERETDQVDVWFEYGTQSNYYGYKTSSQNVTGGSMVSVKIRQFPLIAGQTYYYRFACTDGYGEELSFTLPPVTPRPATTYGDAADQFIYSFRNPDTMVDDMTEAIWSPYIVSLGALFWALVIGAIFMNLAMKGHSIAIPTILVLVIGVSLWSFVPPEFVIIAQAFLILGIAGMIYYIYTKRKL